MSRLLGPLSVITSSVSWRDWARAGDHTAGAGNRLPAATAVIDLRNSRRFMAASARVRWDVHGSSPQGPCQRWGALRAARKALGLLGKIKTARVDQTAARRACLGRIQIW